MKTVGPLRHTSDARLRFIDDIWELQVLADDTSLYLACPYTHQGSVENPVSRARVRTANCIAGALMRHGFVVFSPLSHSDQVHAASATPANWEFWSKQDFWFVSATSALLVLGVVGWQQSVGVNDEIGFALVQGKPVFVLSASGCQAMVNVERAARRQRKRGTHESESAA